MSRKTVKFRARNETIAVNVDFIETDFVPQEIFRDYFVRGGSFWFDFNNWKHEHMISLVLDSSPNPEFAGTTLEKTAKLLSILNPDGAILKNVRFIPSANRVALFMPINNCLKGLRFCISGEGQRFWRKDQLRTVIQYSGGTNINNVSKSDFLIFARADQKQSNAKIEVARRKGIPILSPREFFAIWYQRFLDETEPSSTIKKFG